MNHRRLVGLVAVIWSLALAAGAGEAFFPLGRTWVGDRELPLPFGVRATFYHQQQDYRLRNVRAAIPTGVPGVTEDAFRVAGVPPAEVERLAAENQVDQVNVQLDLWLLPFLNVFGFAGYLDGVTEVRLPDTLAQQVGVGKMDVVYDGPLFGAGALLAGGFRSVFGSVTAAYSSARPSSRDTTVESLVVVPRIGLALARPENQPAWTIWIGAMYQEVEERTEGTFFFPGIGIVLFDLELEQQQEWNTLMGLRVALDEHWALELEGGFGDRKNFAVSAVRRF